MGLFRQRLTSLQLSAFSPIQWGGPTMLPVPGDYDGSGKYDLAVYEQGSGNWFIRFANEAQSSKLKAQSSKGWCFQPSAFSFSAQWGGPGFAQVSGDYDGDGIHDLAVYHQALDLWYVTSVDGTIIAWAEQWGGPGFAAISGDYTGDGKSELAVYDIVTGDWFIRGANEPVSEISDLRFEIAPTAQWGGAGFLPVLEADAAVKPVGLTPIYRVYSYGHELQTLEHFFTADSAEAEYLASTPYWIDEGTAWYALVSHSGDAFPLYRVYNATTKVHYYTLDASVNNTLVSQGWTGEGACMYVWATASAGRSSVYQFYNAAIDKYLYTADENEKVTLMSDPAYGYAYQGIAFYVYARE